MPSPSRHTPEAITSIPNETKPKHLYLNLSSRPHKPTRFKHGHLQKDKGEKYAPALCGVYVVRSTEPGLVGTTAIQHHIDRHRFYFKSKMDWATDEN